MARKPVKSELEGNYFVPDSNSYDFYGRLIKNQYCRMNIHETALYILGQTEVILKQVKQEDYRKILPSYGASIGQHTRHMIEFYLCLFEGFTTGKVNYDLRNRNSDIEDHPVFAIEQVQEIGRKIRSADNDQPIMLELNYDIINNENTQVKSSFSRELVYNIEHSIHHMAIIKTMMIDHFSYIAIPENYGIALSTLRHRNNAFN